MACLSACSGLASRGTAGSPVDEGEPLTALVRYGTYVNTLDEAEIDRHYRELLTQYRALPTSDTAIKLSLILSRPGAPPAALSQALALLANACSGRGDDAEFGRVIYHLVGSRYRAATDNGSLAAELSAEQARSTQLDAELTETRATLEAAEREVVALVRRFDALKAIEAQITHDAAPAE